MYYWTRDMEVAVAFYRDVVGLALVRRDGDSWAEFDAGSIRFALHGAGEGNTPPQGGTAVFEVDDLDASVLALESRGASFQQRDGEVPGYARFASLADPDGNILQLIEYVHGR